MVKKSLAALVLLGGLGAPVVAHAAPNAPQAASDVQVGWVDGKVRISWTEGAGIPNTVSLELPGKPRKVLGTTTAAGHNQLIVEPSALEPTNDPASVAKIVVSDPSTAEARSAGFDRYVRGATPLAPVMTGTGVLNWQFPADPAVDSTPNDPLDVDAPARFVPKLTLGVTPGTTAECKTVVLPATTTPHGSVPKQISPYALELLSVSEWGQSKLAAVRVRSSTTTFSTPGATIYGARITMTGAIRLQTLQNPAAGNCENVTDTAGLAGHEMVLHARDNGGAWYAVGVSKTDAQGKYQFVVSNPGARQYRAVLKTAAAAGAAHYQSISAERTVRATPQVLDASFVDDTITAGQQPNARVTVAPYGSHQVALQFKNASGQWQGLMYRTLSAGRAESGPFAFSRPGDTQFRWWVASSTSSAGLPVDAGYTYPFTLHVR